MHCSLQLTLWLGPGLAIALARVSALLHSLSADGLSPYSPLVGMQRYVWMLCDMLDQVPSARVPARAPTAGANIKHPPTPPSSTPLCPVQDLNKRDAPHHGTNPTYLDNRHMCNASHVTLDNLAVWATTVEFLELCQWQVCLPPMYDYAKPLGKGGGWEVGDGEVRSSSVHIIVPPQKHNKASYPDHLGGCRVCPRMLTWLFLRRR